MYCWATERFSTKPPFSYLRNMNGMICISEEQLLWVIITALGLCFSKESWARSIFQQPRNFSSFCRSDPTVKCQKWPVNWLLVLRSDPRRVFGETPLTPYRAIAHLGSPAGGGRKGLRAVRRKFGSHHTGFRDTGHMGTILSWGIWLQLKLYEAEYHHSF